MKDYAVTWEMDVQADSPVEAARIAWRSMRDKGSIANCFTICDDKGELTYVDLEEVNQGGSNHENLDL